MKYDTCPNCDSRDLRDCWQKERKLQQSCRECEWIGEVRIPEPRQINTIRNYFPINNFGFRYEIYDQYGHPIILSRSYSDESLAETELKKDLEQCNNIEDYGPCVGLLWPDKIAVECKVYENT